jgi:histidine ammonia-lyase
MACHGARRLLDMAANLERIVAIEALTAAQGVELRAPLATGPRLARALAAIRAEVPALSADRVLAGDLERAAALVRTGALVEAAGTEVMPTAAAG